MVAKLYICGLLIFSLLADKCVAMHGLATVEPSPVTSESPGTNICDCDTSNFVSQLDIGKLRTSLTAETMERQKLELSLLAQVEEKKNLEMLMKNLELSLLSSQKDMERRLTSLEESRMNKTRQPMVAFSARVLKEPYELKGYQAIVFKSVVINVGAGYNNTTGEFRCPVPGFYQFSVSLRSIEKRIVLTLLRVNGLIQMEITSSGTEDVGSNTVIVELQDGDLVWVENDSASVRYLSSYYSTFTGHLLHVN